MSRPAFVEELLASQPSDSSLSALFSEQVCADIESCFQRTLLWTATLDAQQSLGKAAGWCSAINSSILDWYFLLGYGHASAGPLLREILDMACSLTFYGTHPVELDAVIRGDARWHGRGNIIIWHRTHTPKFSSICDRTGLADKLDALYRELSKYVHRLPGSHLPDRERLGQWPATDDWVQHILGLGRRCDELVNLLFLTVFWEAVGPAALPDQKLLLAGVPGPVLQELHALS